MRFTWDQTAFVELLCVMPTRSDDHGADYTFVVEQSPLTLTIGLNEVTGDCSVLLHCVGNEIFRAIYLGSPGARVVLDGRGHFLELGAPGSFAGPYDARQPLAQGLRVYLNPHLRVELFGGGEAL